MATKNPLSANPSHICDNCNHIFEDGEDIFITEEEFEFCEECWHEDQDHNKCANCDEWIEPDNIHAFFDNDWDEWFCNIGCQESYISDMNELMERFFREEKLENLL